MNLLGTPSSTDPKGKIFVAKNGSFIEEFLSKEVSGRKVELHEVVVPSLELESIKEISSSDSYTD